MKKFLLLIILLVIPQNIFSHASHYKNYNMRLVQQVNNYTSMTYKDRSVM